jgi:PleD family two-component response regulator
MPAATVAREFVILLPDTDNAGAHIFAERLRQRIEAMVVTKSSRSASRSASAWPI